MKSDKEVVEIFKKQQREATRALSSQYDNTRLCQSYYNDAGSSYSDTVQFSDSFGRKRRAVVNFQKIGQNIDSVNGFLMQNRRVAKFIARVNKNEGQQLYTRNMNALYDFHRENCNADQLESRQNLDMLVNGYGGIDTDLSYIIGNATTMPGGEIIKARIDPMKLYWDAGARAPNLLDKRYVGYYNDYHINDALSLFQGSSEEDFEAVSSADPQDDTGYVYNPYGGLYDKIKASDSVEWASRDEEMVRVYNHQWFEYETYYRAPNPLYAINDLDAALYAKERMDAMKGELKSYSPDGINAGDLFDFDPTAEEVVCDESTKAKLKKEFGSMYNPVPFTRKCFYTAVISKDHVFTKFKSICQQSHSINIKTGQYNERARIWIGMVNGMIEPQKYYNKALTELMFTIASNSKGGVMVEKNAVEDIADFSQKWAKTDGVIVVNDGALTGGKIQEKARPAVPTGLQDIITLSESAIMSNGVDPAFLGKDSAGESGILYKRRIRQIISKMAWAADAETLYQKEDARLCADLIRVWVENNRGATVRVTGDDGADEFMRIVSDMLAPEYDVDIQEGAQTPEDKEETAQLISSIADKYLSVGNMQTSGVLYAEALQMLPIDGEVRGRMTRALVGDESSVPVEQFMLLKQQLEQLQSQLAQAQANLVQSQAAVNIAKVDEIRANTRNKGADTIKTINDADRINTENRIMKAHMATAKVSV